MFLKEAHATTYEVVLHPLPPPKKIEPESNKAEKEKLLI